MLGETPKRFDPINMTRRISKFILPMLDAVMLVVTDIYQAIIATPAVTVNHASGIHFPAYNALKRLFTGIWDNLGVHFSLALEDAKDNRFARRSPATGASCSDHRAIFTRNRPKIAVTRRLSPVNSALSVAVKSMAKYRINCRNLASEILERL